MNQDQHDNQNGNVSSDSLPHCCPCGHSHGLSGMSRRGFLGGIGAATAMGGAVLSGLSWSALAAAEPEVRPAPPRRPLVVKPVLIYEIPKRAPQTSWRSWGGIQTQQDADQETARIKGELEKLGSTADFPVQFLRVASVHNVAELAKHSDVASADVLLVYAAGSRLDGLEKLNKHVVIFLRHQSGPVYLHYEIVSPCYLRRYSDEQKIKGIEPQDVVVDNVGELTWRLRSLCGLVNTLGTKILAIGGPGAWAQPGQVVPDLVRKKFKFDIVTVPYPDLGKLIQAARKDEAQVALARQRTADYLKIPATKLETKREFLENAFVLEQVFRRLMEVNHCKAITINGCMGTIMPMAETSACMCLSTLNDDGYMAFCESDFVVIPSGVLLVNIANKPMFFNDPTYPHDGIITLAHCTGPRKLDGKNLEPVRVLTHFESDYGAAPKVEMRSGQKVTNIIPDFKQERYVGLLGDIVCAPFLPICRCQIDIKFTCPDHVLAERMPGFHWMTIYGDYMKEAGYALKKIGIRWESLG
jgi:hypothetical protein